MSGQSKSLISALFDLSFNEFVTTRVIRVFYVISLVLIFVGAIAGVISALGTMTQSFFTGAAMLVFVPLASILYLILARVAVEGVIVMFRISENVAKIAESGRPPQGQPQQNDLRHY